MKKIIIRSGMSPFEKKTAVDMLVKNVMGGNIGNLVYSNSIFRATMRPDTEVVSDHYQLEHKLSDAAIDEINETADMYIIPLADAFRKNYGNIFNNMAENINRLKIPVIVVGVGVRNKLESGSDFSSLDSIKDSAKKFVSAVLDHSAMIGTRGESTLKYLTGLGFPKDSITPIGCPSLYTFGPDIKLKKLNVDFDSPVMINNSQDTTNNVHNFMRKVQANFKNYIYVPQRDKELRTLFAGVAFNDASTAKKKLYPKDIDDPFFNEDHARFFLSAPSWIEFSKTMELSIGPRFHGGVVPIIAGTPSIIIAKDVRMMELVKFHHLPYIDRDEVGKFTDIMELISSIDFSGVQKHNPANFAHYIDFLDKNGIPHIFGKDENIESVYDKNYASADFLDPIHPITTCSPSELGKRMTEYFKQLGKL
ncbi:MAG: polysaccharide pyruvyl transferase family protein [Lachnospiraceae bacterium]|nr:polysaccharide pyruvyl transferase family protein [Lachnospiraceae bacterium]